MSIASWLVVFLISLPAAVWLLANVLSLLDQRPLHQPLIRLLASVCAVLAALLLTDRAWIHPFGVACTLVTVLHLSSGFAMRLLLLGAERLERKGPGDEGMGRGGEACHRDTE